jgi:hypothetical protein
MVYEAEQVLIFTLSDKMQFSPTFPIFRLTFLVQQNCNFSPTKYILVRQLYISQQKLLVEKKNSSKKELKNICKINYIRRTQHIRCVLKKPQN